VRKNFPYYIYDKVKFTVPVESGGDAFSRYRIRFREMQESIKIIRQALDMMPEGSVAGQPIKLIGQQAKPDPVFMERELPRGNGIIYMIPDKQRPFRIALRSPAYINLSLLPMLCKGEKFADLFAILGSIDVVMAEIDK
jgi:NADH-quinone oxidoreductase subunit D